MIKILAMTTVNPNEIDALNNYLDTVGPLVEGAGGKLIERFEVNKTIIGANVPQYTSIIEYPNMEAVMQVFQSAAYRSIETDRNKAFSEYKISILST